MKRHHLVTTIAAACIAAGTVSTALASHSWGGYHWARTTNSFELQIVNSTTPDWDPYVDIATDDWSASSVLDMRDVDIDTGDTSNKTRRQCRADQGTVRICNLEYGYNGWLGVAGISIDSNDHITSGYTKLNDSYFNASYYNKDVWRQSVTCQELGHNVGLDHQDEDFNNTPIDTCMDYRDPPWPTPNKHDYDELASIYGHTDDHDSYVAYDSGSGGGGGNDGGGGGNGCNAPPGKGCNKAGFAGEVGWGASLGRRGNHEDFIRIDPDGTIHLTHVIWAIGY